jgi:hypothetical protein
MSLNDTNDRHRADGRGYLWLSRAAVLDLTAHGVLTLEGEEATHMIDVLRDQIIVCGCGRLGRTVADEREAVAT